MNYHKWGWFNKVHSPLTGIEIWTRASSTWSSQAVSHARIVKLATKMDFWRIQIFCLGQKIFLFGWPLYLLGRIIFGQNLIQFATGSIFWVLCCRKLKMTLIPHSQTLLPLSHTRLPTHTFFNRTCTRTHAYPSICTHLHTTLHASSLLISCINPPTHSHSLSHTHTHTHTHISLSLSRAS